MAREGERNKTSVDAMEGKRNYTVYSESISPLTGLLSRANRREPAPGWYYHTIFLRRQS